MAPRRRAQLQLPLFSRKTAYLVFPGSSWPLTFSRNCTDRRPYSHTPLYHTDRPTTNIFRTLDVRKKYFDSQSIPRRPKNFGLIIKGFLDVRKIQAYKKAVPGRNRQDNEWCYHHSLSTSSLACSSAHSSGSQSSISSGCSSAYLSQYSYASVYLSHFISPKVF